jgi:hypothetical protein
MAALRPRLCRRRPQQFADPADRSKPIMPVRGQGQDSGARRLNFLFAERVATL